MSTKPIPALIWCIRAATVLLALLQAYVMRHYLNEDGVSYLDLGDAYLRGDWQAGVNGTWSPLYTWLTGAVLAIVQPSAYWQFATVKLLNVALLIATMFAFEWFLSEVAIRLRDRETASLSPLPEPYFRLLAWLIFPVASLNMTSVGLVTPDLLVNLFGFLLAAVIARGRRLPLPWAWSLLMGAFIGFGYLAKAPLLPLGMIFLLVYLINIRPWPSRLLHLALSLLVVALIAGPYILALSHKLDRWAFTDASRINYLWFVNGVAKCRWQTDRTDLGQPLHPPTQLHHRPDLFAFDETVPGTNPLWYDPGHWCEGLSPRIALSEQLANLRTMTLLYLGIVLKDAGVFLLGTLVLAVFAWNAVPARDKGRQAASSLVGEYPLLLIPLLASAMYVLVYVESRYLAMYAMLFLTGCLASIRYPHDQWDHLRNRAVFVAVLFAIPTLGMLGFYAFKSWQEFQTGEGGHAHQHWHIAHELHQLGLRPGDTVAVIGYPLDCGWARLGEFRIAAEINELDAADYWQAPPEEQQHILTLLRNQRIKAALFTHPPPGVTAGTEIPHTSFQVQILPPIHQFQAKRQH
jgi:hypothetical protein